MGGSLKTKFKRLVSSLNIAGEYLIPLLSVPFALFIGAIVLLLMKVNPLEAYGSLFKGAFGSVSAITQTLVKATPLLLVGLGVTIAFRGGVINIGGEGQLVAGALAGTAVALSLPDTPKFALIPLVLLSGVVAGGVWGGIPGILKARLGVNEILSTIMMNAIALRLSNFLLGGIMIDPKEIEAGTLIAQSAFIPKQSWLARLVPQTMLHSGAILAVILAVVVYFLLWHTTIGYRIRAVGLNPKASKYAGISVPSYQALSLILGGALAGLAGSVEVLGVYRRMVDGLSGGYGFTGIVAALFGGLHPLGAIPASVLFGSLLVGADKMQRATQTPTALISTLLGLIVLFVVGSEYWSRKLARKREMND